MEGKSMKFTKLTILAGSFLLLFSLSSAGENAVKKEHFLSINQNINNVELRAELEILMKAFDAERQRIQGYYTEEIEKLQEERRSEVKTLKNEFGKKREILLRKYGEERKLFQSKSDQINLPDKKTGKDKKPLRKPK